MALLAPNSVIEDAYRSAQVVTVRSALLATTAYVGAGWLRTAGAQWVSLDFALVWGAGTSVEWRWDWSYDGTTWFPDTAIAVTGGVATVAAASSTIAVTASVNWNDGPIRVRGNFMRPQVKVTGVTTDTVAIVATLFVDKTRGTL